MRILVLGTSNSLMTEGWVNQILKETQGRNLSIKNRSIGGSSSRYGAFLTASLPLRRDHDAIIFDYAIPDGMLLDSGCISAQDILGHYVTIGRDLIRQDALDKALVLILPRMGDLEQSEMLDQICALLTELGIDFLDFRPFIAEIMAEAGRKPESVYPDPRHFAPEIQKRIGQHVLRHLAERRRRRRRTVAARALATLPEPGYRQLQLTAPAARKPQEYGSSIMSFPALSLEADDSMAVSGAEYLIGALIWTHDNSGSVTIYGRDAGIRLHLRRTFKNIFLFDSLTTALELDAASKAVVTNDANIPHQRALGLSNTIYDRQGASCEIVTFLGCDIPPAQYHAMFADAPRPPPRHPATEIILGLVQPITRFAQSLLQKSG